MKYRDLQVSIIVPVRNEAGNIENVIRTIPKLGNKTEIIFVESGSTDDTAKEIVRAKNEYPSKKIILIRLKKRGKYIAVRQGFLKACGEIVIILDGDLTVSPDYLKIFYKTLIKNPSSLVLGNRFFYPIEKNAMKKINQKANIAYAKLISWIIGKRLDDALCGMKGLYKKDFIKMERFTIFREFDPFGDFDLIFSAVVLNLKIIEIPVIYLARRYGKSNINRLRDGWSLFLLILRGAWYFKFSNLIVDERKIKKVK